VVVTFVALTIPVLALAAQCARLGAPARDRRLAAIRLAGATPGQTITIGAGESALAATIGSLAGTGIYAIARRLMDHPDRYGTRPLPTDVLPPAWAVVAVVLVGPVLIGLLSARLLRRVGTTPLGVVRQVRRRRGPGPWAGLLIVGGMVLFSLMPPAMRYAGRHHLQGPGWVPVVALYAGLIAVCVGIAIGAGFLGHTAGRLLGALGRSPASRLAGARLVADPWSGSRAMGVLMIAALFAGGTAGVYQMFVTQRRVDDEAVRAATRAAGPAGAWLSSTDGSFYTSTTMLVGIAIGIAMAMGTLSQLVSLSETVTSRRRAYTALVATGVPRSVLIRTQMWQTFSIAVPAFALAVGTGCAIPRVLMHTTITAEAQTIPIGSHLVKVAAITEAVPVPWSLLALALGTSLAAVAVTAGIGALFLRAGTRISELRTS